VTRRADVVVVGSGFGGALAAWPLVHAGADVLMLERGPWVDRGPHTWEPGGTITRTPFYDTRDHYVAETDKGRHPTSATSCVGGPSVFYGGVSLRFREDDFRPPAEIVGDSGARWPIGYAELAPAYDEAERILSVSGLAGEDPTEPPRSGPFPCPPGELSAVSAHMARAGRSNGLRPFRLPLAINYGHAPRDSRDCIACSTCDTFACAISAKNDLATAVIPRLQAAAMRVRDRALVTELVISSGAVAGVVYRDTSTGEELTIEADTVILAAGALGSPHILLSSGAEELNPAGDVVGRYLTRHCSGIVFGAYTWVHRHEGRHHKQIGFNDYYLGDPDGGAPAGPLGNIQQTQTPNLGTVSHELGRLATFLIAPLVRRSTGLLVIAEDRPQYGNRVLLDRSERDRYGMPRMVIEHSYDDRDYAAREHLIERARDIHRSAGALATYIHRIHTFSHALGTVRMGDDARAAPLAPDCGFRGIDNLYVTDGSALPSAGGVNPSLTIAANALRVGRIIAERVRAKATRARAR